MPKAVGDCLRPFAFSSAPPCKPHRGEASRPSDRGGGRAGLSENALTPPLSATRVNPTPACVASITVRLGTWLRVSSESDLTFSRQRVNCRDVTVQARFEFTYDAESDTLGIWLPGQSSDAQTRVLAPGVHADLTADGRLTSLEILDASSRYPAASLRKLESPIDWMTLLEAAGESGLTPDTLRRQIANGRLAARKRGRDWLVSRAALWTYLENRAPSGRPPASRKGEQVRRRASLKRALPPRPGELGP